MFWQPLCLKQPATWSLPHSENERQPSVNKFGCCILYNPRAVLRNLPIIGVLAAFIGNIVNVDVPAPENERQQSVNRASTECQQSVNRASTQRQQSVNRASTERQQSINTASTECQQTVNDFGCCILCNLRAMLWDLSMIEVLATFLGNMVRVDLATPNNEHQQSHSRALTILGIASCIIQGFGYGISHNLGLATFICNMVIVNVATILN